MKSFTDQMGRTVQLVNWPPRRIISLVPSQTEFLADLGLDEQVVGITKFCIHPTDWFQNKKRVGGTKTLNFQKIEALQPDLILGNKEENEQSQIESLAERYPVWMSDIYTLEDALDMMRRFGEVTGKTLKANTIADEIDLRFTQRLALHTQRLKVAYLIWRKPYMVAAAGTFIDHMLQHAGFENAFQDRERYPEVSAAELARVDPEVILLSSEPYPFSEKHISALQEICPKARIQLVDGEMFSWYGSRLLQVPGYFAALRKAVVEI
jgi:ABC-type Fe3+-hydroxamate transport system substrate-binding protein